METASDLLSLWHSSRIEERPEISCECQLSPLMHPPLALDCCLNARGERTCAEKEIPRIAGLPRSSTRLFRGSLDYRPRTDLATVLVIPACRNLEPSRSQADDLTDTKLACSDNCPINARVVVVHADHGLH